MPEEQNRSRINSRLWRWVQVTGAAGKAGRTRPILDYRYFSRYRGYRIDILSTIYRVLCRYRVPTIFIVDNDGHLAVWRKIVRR